MNKKKKQVNKLTVPPACKWYTNVPLSIFIYLYLSIYLCGLVYQQTVIAALAPKMFGRLSKNTIPRNYEFTNKRLLSCAKERLMKSGVAKHYGCKRVRYYGLIANGRSQANLAFFCVRNVNCCFGRVARCAAKKAQYNSFTSPAFRTNKEPLENSTKCSLLSVAPFGHGRPFVQNMLARGSDNTWQWTQPGWPTVRY